MTRSIPIPLAMIIISLAPLPAVVAQPATPSDRPADRSDAASAAAPLLPSEQAAKQRLEEAGYTDVHGVRSSAEGMAAKATKDGKQFDISIDSFGKIIARAAQ